MPPPPKMDAYLKARVDKMYAQLAVSSLFAREISWAAAAPLVVVIWPSCGTALLGVGAPCLLKPLPARFSAVSKQAAVSPAPLV